MIPPRLIRTIPEHTSAEVERFWEWACELHPGWDHITYRDPLDPADFPYTSPAWDLCTSGAQRAGLIRLEALWLHGGIYIDSDVELYRPLDALLDLRGFAAWEDTDTVPDAVLGAEDLHPALWDCLQLALERIRTADRGWRFAWETGPGVTTAVLAGRADFLLLPPGAFFPYHYTERHRRHEDHAAANPWAFGAHHWHASWLPEEARP